MTLAALALATTLATNATAQEQVYNVGDGVTTPVPTRIAHAQYTPGR